MQNTQAFKKYFRAANYISAIQIYLRDNFLLKEPLKPEHIKPRLLGHWGTCPGISFVNGALQYTARKYRQKSLYLVGPGHGFPAVQSGVFLENTLVKYDPRATQDLKGLSYIAANFSTPYGFQSHSNPTTPGVILEGGELGYALSTAYGSVLDNPDLLSVCLVGDGEAETGPTAAAWYLNKLVNHPDNGTVLPVLHLNEYKISGPTFFGRMSNKNLIQHFDALGYTPIVVSVTDAEDIFSEMLATMDKCMEIINQERQNYTEGRLMKYPMIILRSPKGWTGIQELHGKKIEGNAPSHQVPGKNLAEDPTELKAVEEWMHSYRFNELFDEEKGFDSEIVDFHPSEDLLPGNSPHFNPEYQPLKLPPIKRVAEEAAYPGEIGSSSMIRSGLYLREVFRENEGKKNFRLFCPDETYSNKLHAIFEVTSRAFQERIEEHDEDMSPDGRVMEMLSEHSLQGLMQGYVLTGRHGVFASYEAFIQIVASMADQYIKFLKIARETAWRKDLPSFNYILTSSGWRQEHNGFSHQNPGFIDDMVNRQYEFVRLFFPYDATSSLLCLEKSLSLKNGVNIITAGKTLEPRWLTESESREALENGLSTWAFASDYDPEIVLSGIGDYVTNETLAALKMLKNDLPDLRIRFVNILELSIFLEDNPVEFDQAKFDHHFTPNKPVIFNFHGYPQTLKQLIFDFVGDPSRITVKGYVEEGSTTTPFDMHVLNGTSRYHLAIDALNSLKGVKEEETLSHLIRHYQQKLEDHRTFIMKHGVDPEEITELTWYNG